MLRQRLAEAKTGSRRKPLTENKGEGVVEWYGVEVSVHGVVVIGGVMHLKFGSGRGVRTILARGVKEVW